MKSSKLAVSIALVSITLVFAQQRPRDLGIKPGVLPTGPLNAITDVAGVKVGQVTLVDEGKRIQTGVTAILPHGGNLFQNKVPGGIHIANAFGKLAGSTQAEELGNIETPVILTNTLSVAEGIAGAVEWTLKQPGNESVMSVNALVGETNDARLNDIRGRHVKISHVIQAIESAKVGKVEEGNVGAGAGTIAFGWKGGIGTSSRVLPKALGGYTIGVLVQTNYGGILTVDGAPIGKELGQYYLKQFAEPAPGGSCMIVIATDAPIDARNLKRLASRSILGLGATGSSTSNGSGEYAIAFSTAAGTRELLQNDAMSPLFQAVKEATEEAVYNSMFAAKTVKDVQGLPVSKVLDILRAYRPKN